MEKTSGILRSMKTELGTISKCNQKAKLRMWEVSVSPGDRPMQHHFHERFEIALITSGGGIYTTERSQYDILSGDIFVFSSNEMHCITSVDENGLTLINLHFDPLLINELLGDNFSVDNNNFCYTHNDAFENRILAPNAGRLTGIFNNIKEEILCHKQEYETMSFLLLEQLIIILIRDYGYISDEGSVNPSALNMVSLAKEYINDHITEKLMLKDIANIVGFSPSYFSDLFKKTCNINVWDYIISRRINMAIKILNDEHQTQTMLQIALRCGFNNTANFNKAFRHQTGMTPLEFIKSDRLII